MDKCLEKSLVIDFFFFFFAFCFTVARTLLAAGPRKDFLGTSKIGTLHKLPLTCGDWPLGVTVIFLNKMLLDSSVILSLHIF